MRLALSTLATFNALLLVALGVFSLRFVDGVSGPVGAVVCAMGAVTLVAASRRLRRPVEWR